MKEAQVLVLLKKKRGFFETILELTEEERHLSLEEWLSVLRQKKLLLHCVEKIDKELGAFKASLEIVSQEITEELEEIKKVIEKILHLDTHNQLQRKNERSPPTLK